MKRFFVLFLALLSLAPVSFAAETVAQMAYVVEMPDVTREGLYTGELLNGIPNGYGVFTAVNSSGTPWHYIGQWVDGKMCGQGGQYWDIGQSFIGIFENNDYVDGCIMPTLDIAGKPIVEWGTEELKWLVNAINTELEVRSDVVTNQKTEKVKKDEATVSEDAHFTVEHDEEYNATRDYIWEFLIDKGYEVQTIIGVPNIGRYEDDDPTDNSVGWYAYLMHKGEWKEFVVMLYNGEVASIMPNATK